MKKTRLIHLLPLLYYIVTRESVSSTDLSALLGLSRATTRSLIWSARRAGLVDYRRVGNKVFLAPTWKAIQIINSVDLFAKKRNKYVIVIGGGVIFAVSRPKKGVRAYPVPLDKLCMFLEEGVEVDNPRIVAEKSDLPPKTISMLKRVLSTLGCPSKYCILNNMCRKEHEDKE